MAASCAISVVQHGRDVERQDAPHVCRIPDIHEYDQTVSLAYTYKAKVVITEWVKEFPIRTCDGCFRYSMRIQELQEASSVNENAEELLRVRPFASLCLVLVVDL